MPITFKNRAEWMRFAELWRSLDDVISRLDSAGHVVITASKWMFEGQLFIEAVAPEGAAQFYHNCVATALSKYVYEAMRNRSVSSNLPAIVQVYERATSKTMYSRGEWVLAPWPKRHAHQDENQ